MVLTKLFDFGQTSGLKELVKLLVSNFLVNFFPSLDVICTLCLPWWYFAALSLTLF